MNLPNKLTLLRIVLIPACIVLWLTDLRIAAVLVFIVAALTDTLDGYLARKHKLITNFGKFADPIADKMLTVSMMVLLSAQGALPVYLPILVILRDLVVDGLRLIAVEQGRVVAAGLAGKIKTTLQMILVCVAMVLEGQSFGGILVTVFSAVVALITLYSGGVYLYQLRDLFKGDLSA